MKERSCIDNSIEKEVSEATIKSANSPVIIIKQGRMSELTKVYRYVRGYEGTNRFLMSMSKKVGLEGIKAIDEEQRQEILNLAKANRVKLNNTYVGGMI